MTERTFDPTSDDHRGTIVFLLGAGCSVDCGMPVMQDFMAHARECVREPGNSFKDDYKALRLFRQECLKICYVFDRWWENIEDLYTQAHLRLLAGLPDAKSLCDSITRVIWDVYRRESTVKKWRGYSFLQPAVHKAMENWQLLERPRPVVITTNYDVQLEAAWTPMSSQYGGDGIPVFYPGSLHVKGSNRIVSGSDYEMIAKLGRIELIKLHGSVNWFDETGGNSDEVLFTCEAAAGDRGFHFCNDAELLSKVKNGARLPLIVPPTLGKTSPPGPITDHWRRAIYNLSNARLIVVAGYSFPETDSFMTRLLAEGIKGNDNLEQMIIINNSTDSSWTNRVERIFTRSYMKNSVLWVRDTFSNAMHAITNPKSEARPLSDPDSKRAIEPLSYALWGKG